MTDRVYMTRRGAVWHSDGACPALDDERIRVGGDVAQVTPREAATARPCLVCQSTATEWTVEPGNLTELLNLIEPSKPYMIDLGDGLVCAGLTIREHGGIGQRRAMIGDTIKYLGGIYWVTPQEQP